MILTQLKRLEIKNASGKSTPELPELTSGFAHSKVKNKFSSPHIEFSKNKLNLSVSSWPSVRAYGLRVEVWRRETGQLRVRGNGYEEME